MIDRKRDISKMSDDQIDQVQKVINDKILHVLTSSKEEIQAILRPYDLDIEFYYEVYSKSLVYESFLNKKPTPPKAKKATKKTKK
jgi:hypothetical protein